MWHALTTPTSRLGRSELGGRPSHGLQPLSSRGRSASPDGLRGHAVSPAPSVHDEARLRVCYLRWRSVIHPTCAIALSVQRSTAMGRIRLSWTRMLASIPPDGPAIATSSRHIAPISSTSMLPTLRSTPRHVGPCPVPILSPARPAPPPAASVPLPPLPAGAPSILSWGGRQPGRPSSRRLAVLVPIAALILATSLSFLTIRPAAAYDGSLNTYACEPYYGPSWTNGETDDLYQATYSTCANIPYGSYGQFSGYTYVSDFVPYNGDGRVWFYV